MDFPPPLRKLQYVLAVARDLHFRKAAERLHVSQPAVSRQIREYEEEIGFEILHRDHHFVSLTKAGRAFVADVEGIVARMEGDFAAAVRRARAISREVPAEYTVGHSPFAPMQIRRIALALQQEEYRDLPMRLRILPTSELLNAIDSEVVQAGITYAPVDHAGVSVIPLAKDHWVAIVPAKGRFSEVVTVTGPAKMIFLAGVGAEDENGKGGDILYKGDFAAQCKYAYDKIRRALEKHGAGFGDVVKVVSYVTDMRYQADYGKCRSEAFGTAPPPAHTLLNITQLAWPGMMLEVDVTAMVPLK